MLRVVTLSTLFPDATRPGFGRFVERQTQELAALDDVAVRVVAPIGIPPWPISLARRCRMARPSAPREYRDGLDVSRPIFLTTPGTGGRFNARLLGSALRRAFDQLWREQPFDVIDAEFFYPDGPAAVALGRRFGVPVSIKARGSDIHYWGTAPATRKQVLDAARAADGLLAVSGALASDMAKLGMPSADVHYTGVDRDLFKPIEREHPTSKAPLVISIGTLDSNKGHAILVEAVARLPDIRLWIAGEGPERGALQRLIARHQFEDRIRLLGRIPPHEVAHLLASADLFALASRAEGLANVWVEALACGTPIVITDAGGAREVVTPANGRIVERSPEALSAAIAEMTSVAPDRAAIRATTDAYRWSDNASRLRDHLQTLVNRRR